MVLPLPSCPTCCYCVKNTKVASIIICVAMYLFWQPGLQYLGLGQDFGDVENIFTPPKEKENGLTNFMNVFRYVIFALGVLHLILLTATVVALCMEKLGFLLDALVCATIVMIPLVIVMDVCLVIRIVDLSSNIEDNLKEIAKKSASKGEDKVKEEIAEFLTAFATQVILTTSVIFTHIILILLMVCHFIFVLNAQSEAME